MTKQWLAIAATVLAAVVSAEPLSTRFTYQGELQVSGAPANGQFDFEFELFDAPENGLPMSTPLTLEDVAVAEGIFSVNLDFGADPFAGDQLWLQVRVRPGASTDPLVPLLPLQELTAAPYALHAEMVAADSISGLEVADNSLTATDLASDSVGSSELQSNSVGSSELANNAVARAAIQTNAVGSAEIEDQSIGLDDIDRTQVQARLFGACEPGSTVESVSEDGKINCAPLSVSDFPRLAGFGSSQYTVSVVDTSAQFGSTTLAIGDGGLPIAAYYDAANGDLKVAHCEDMLCTEATITVVDSGGIVGQEPSITVLGSGLPAISYYDATNGNLKLARCDNARCTQATITVIDSDGDVGAYSAIVNGQGEDDLRIGYHDVDNGGLKYIRCTSSFGCDEPIVADSSTGDVGRHVSAMVPAGPNPSVLLSYFDAENDLTRIVRCTNICFSPVLIDFEQPAAGPSDLILGADGFPMLVSVLQSAPNASRIQVVDCMNFQCSSFNLTAISNLFSDLASNRFVTATRLTAGQPIIVSQVTGIRRCRDASCSGMFQLQSADCARGADLDIKLGADLRPILACVNGDGALAFTRCGNEFCNNAVRH